MYTSCPLASASLCACSDSALYHPDMYHLSLIILRLFVIVDPMYSDALYSFFMSSHSSSRLAFTCGYDHSIAFISFTAFDIPVVPHALVFPWFRIGVLLWIIDCISATGVSNGFGAIHRSISSDEYESGAISSIPWSMPSASLSNRCFSSSVLSMVIVYWVNLSIILF